MILRDQKYSQILISMKLKDKVVIITGGSGGIGSVISKFFINEGAKVVVFSRNNTKISGLCVDVSDYKTVRVAVASVLKKFKHIDGVVNCAGIQAPIGPFLENDMDLWKKNIEVNLLGTIYLCRATAPIMIKQKNGFIINFSGGGATGSRENFSAYAVAKTGVLRFTEILANELKRYHIRVNAIAPGAVNTKMLEEVLNVGKGVGKVEFESARKRAREGGTSPELAAELAVFLASRDSGDLSGCLISAVWDDWKSWKKDDIKKIITGDSLKLRRMK